MADFTPAADAVPLSTRLDARFSEATDPLPWPETEALLVGAELYWLTTVRDGRPHTTPLVGLWHESSFVFCTGAEEQKARNLQRAPAVGVTTGTNAWAAGTDVVVNGTAARVTGPDVRVLADAYRAKYGEAWDFEADAESFDPDGQGALVFRVVPERVMAFTKDPHGQTTYRF